MTAALQYITNIDITFPKPGQNNSSQGFRNNFNNIKLALSNLNSYMDSLAATSLNVAAPSITATQYLHAMNNLVVGDTNKINISLQGYNALVSQGRNSNGSLGSGVIPLFLHVIPVGRYSYGTDVTYGDYFVASTDISRVIVNGTFYNLDKTIKFTVNRIDIDQNRIYFSPASNNLPATVNITNPTLGEGYNVFQQTLGSILPYGIIVLWYGSVGNVPEGWNLCDGTNGTPDLRNRFVVGAGGERTVADVGGRTDAVLPSHNHTFVGDALPVHQHDSGWGEAFSPPYGAARYPATGSARTDNDNYSFLSSPVSGGTPQGTITFAGVDSVDANLPPYYALCYIMKVV